ncbi:MAG: hypothetical protein SOU51_01850 [Collinsella sp.]|nr:hypothetical protein [Collinsella sp.]
MTDKNTPLSDEERAELEELRAEKARRERAELERLRLERPSRPVVTPEPEAPAIDPENLTFGQKMVMTRGEEDEDGIPPMPPAQKIIIGLCFLAVAVALAWMVLGNVG